MSQGGLCPIRSPSGRCALHGGAGGTDRPRDGGALWTPAGACRARWRKSSYSTDIGGDCVEVAAQYVRGGEDRRDPLFDLGQRQVRAPVAALAQDGPLRLRVDEGGELLLQRADHGVLGGIELPVGPHRHEPGEALGQEDEQPRQGRQDRHALPAASVQGCLPPWPRRRC
ncbi:DUF397 domain-containing protein [Streptomyces sp. NPDC059564]|uniref:DUF397 domain-containing protein n=1 Tax=Streptomyces sp. NPDC059564 TaxID=3346865 RepID=UPI0036CBF40D